MNFLTEVKKYNKYDIVCDDLYTEDEPKVPITDIDGTTALLETDGTSWQLINGEWEQIEVEIDNIIKTNFMPFLMSACHSIHNHFINCKYALHLPNILFSKDEDGIILETQDDALEFLINNDFIWLSTSTGEYLTYIVDKISDSKVLIYDKGIDIRITGKEECVALCLASFPMGFVSDVAKLMQYDLFEREDKEVKVERLGNYSITNADIGNFYGDEAYPEQIIKRIKYWQRIGV